MRVPCCVMEAAGCKQTTHTGSCVTRLCPCLGVLQVKLGLEEVATDLFKVKPYVYSSPSNSAVIVFSGTDASCVGSNAQLGHNSGFSTD